MMNFWILVTALLVGAILYVAVSARRARLRVDLTTPEIVFERRSVELARDVASGQIDATQAEAATEELARQALHEVPPAPTLKSPQGRRPALLVLAILVPVVAVSLYFVLGTPALLDGVAAGAREHMSMEQMVVELQKRIDADPNDPEARLWMARVMMASEQYGQAVDQYAKILALVGEQPDVLVQYADALAMLNGGRMAGKPRELVERALQADPEHFAALWLAGLAAHEAGDVPRARDLLGKARAVAVATHRPTEQLDAQLAALGIAPADAATPGAPGTPAAPAVSAAPAGPAASADAAPRIEVTVTVVPELIGRIDAGAMLFVLAKQPSGMSMPLAVRRLPAQDFPVAVTLDDSAAVAPMAKLSMAAQVEVIARVSRSGQADAASGDLEGRAGPVTVDGTQRISVTIDRTLP